MCKKVARVVYIFFIAMLLVGCDMGAQVSDSNGGGKDKASGALVVPGNQQGDIQVNTAAPDFTLNDANGKPVNLLTVASAHKLTIVNFWASWCPPCRAEMPDLADVYNKYKGAGLEILGVNDQESVDQIHQYASDGGYTWPLLLTTNGDVITAYHAGSLPNSYFVDSKGIIVHVVRGAMNHAELVSTLAQYGFN